MINFNNYIRAIRARGNYTFTFQQAIKELNISEDSLKCGMYKLKKKGEVVSPVKGFYIVIPPEYQILGCLPAEELIPLLVEHWNIEYYACLLSAALYYGAAHQKPQVFQVMTIKQLRPLVCGKVRINFLYKKSLTNVPLRKITVKTGYLHVSTPEATVMDLLMYVHQAGGLNHVATVLSELIESVDLDKMLEILRGSKEKAWIQRLGYILEHIDPMESEKRDKLIALVFDFLKTQHFGLIPLASELSTIDMPKNNRNQKNRWNIIENTTIESDI